MCKCPLIYFTEIICSTANIFLYRSHYLHSNKLGLRAKYHFREIIDRMAPPLTPRPEEAHICSSKDVEQQILLSSKM